MKYNVYFCNIITIHNLPEGMAVGVVFAGETQGMTVSAALAVAIGIAILNILEGAIISMPMHAEGKSCWRSFGFAVGFILMMIGDCVFA